MQFSPHNGIEEGHFQVVIEVIMVDLQELKEIRALAEIKDDLVECHELARVQSGDDSYPITAFTIGSKDPEAPVFGLFGGVHGLERIGTHLVTNYLHSFLKQLRWNSDLREVLKRSRIVSIPLINPGGMANGKRSNPNGVDLMRNSPIEADEQERSFLLSGHRISDKLPWFQGKEGLPPQKEFQAVVDFVEEQMFESVSAQTIDCHSGFGVRDRLWFPWAKSKEPCPDVATIQNFKDLLDDTFPFHIYIIEQTSASYAISGDMWDYIYQKHLDKYPNREKVFIPWTLEMGSWSWVRKNPLQIFEQGGFFNPIKEHRYDRTMRRHLQLMDFYFKVIRNSQAWCK